MMPILRVRCWLHVVWFASLTACAHTAATSSVDPKAPPPNAPPQAVAEPPTVAPALIEIRVLVVAYRGAQGASASQQRTQPEALERARMLCAMAKSGEHLTELVRQYSDRPGATEDLGVVRLRPQDAGPFTPAVAHAALALPVGGVSDAIGDATGYVVIERLKDPPVGPERIAARHILIGYAGAPKSIPGATRTEAEARALAEKIATEAKAGADWNALAAQYTDEPGSKATGGDLGKFGRGQMVPSFEQAAFALDVGQISDVVQSPFGFHVIRRYE